MTSLSISLLLMWYSSLCHCELSIIDMSHPLSGATVYWPGQPNYNRTVLQRVAIGDDVWIEVGAYSSGEHGGTHVDAPRHFFPNGLDLKDLPLERTIADGVVIDVKAESARNSDYALTVEKLQEWELSNGRIPPKAAVVVNNGWTVRWPDPSAFLGSNDLSNYTTFHFPIVSIDAARWLLEKRDIKILGSDVPAPDGPRDNTFPVHRLLLAQNVIILENVMIPDELPARGFRVHAAPMRVQGGTGVQTRIYAILNDVINGAEEMRSVSLITCVLLAVLSKCLNFII
ncbi:unnamed protein product [Lymnaea stagnalis]|uniref:Kynurenine formamidase n=1 Tax=Lymnaea stagnalis TaxID=6523 RepID=A0AAV2H4K4_LYMST